MRKTILACVGSVILSALSPAFAADMPVKGVPAPYIAPYYNWTGFYVGINAGYGFGKSRWTTSAGVTTGDFNTNGFIVGGTLGYNYQMGAIVWGIEGDFDWSNIKGTTLGVTTANTYLATARVRVGYAFDRWMPYLTGGGAYGNIKMTSALGSYSEGNFGWTAGAGVEWAFLPGWSAKVEYLYVDLGDATCPAGTCTALVTTGTFQTSLIRGGINYRF